MLVFRKEAGPKSQVRGHFIWLALLEETFAMGEMLQPVRMMQGYEWPFAGVSE